jgi:CRISPR-associated protein Cmr3
LLPVGLTEAQAPNDFKPSEPPAWWPADLFAAWLAKGKVAFNERFLRAPEVEKRTHVQLDAHAGATEDRNLFTTAALPLSHLRRYGAHTDGTHAARFAAVTLAARVRATDWCSGVLAELDTLHPLGGERRLVHWKATSELTAWSCPQPLRSELASASRIRMVLATPAVFGGGWRPAWVNDELVGTPPGANIVLRLVGVTIQRWQAVSGWSLANLPGQPRGPKPVKRLVPAGGVYFFEAVNGSGSCLANRWLESVSDDEQDRRDGFGLAAWGVW